LQREFMRKHNRLGDAQVGEDGVRLHSRVAAQRARKEAAGWTGAGRSVDVAGKVERSGERILGRDGKRAAACGTAAGRDSVRAVGERVEVEVCVGP
jgi:hypothetical protein